MNRDNVRQNFKRYQFLLMLLTLLGLPLLESCEQETNVYLSRAERARVDTIYLERVDSVKIITDSICEMLERDSLQYFVDSIVLKRKKEAEKIKSRSNPFTQR